MDREAAMLKVVEDVVVGGMDLIPGWRLLENAKSAAGRGGPEELRRYYERCLKSNDPKGKHVTATLQQHGRKTLESEYRRFMAAYGTGSTSGDSHQSRRLTTGASSSPTIQEVSAEDLGRYRRCVDRLLDQIEPRQGQDEKLVPRIRQLGRSRKIPRKIEPLMLTVAEIRNASEHDRNPPSRDERLAAKHAWDAIAQWASEQGLALPDGNSSTTA